jgi:alkanesulfonate monooxygenase SsuD/methylene tetrahydromethanopterin reductase-like flavin-dependent oxidoreductase (luciferase family)
VRILRSALADSSEPVPHRFYGTAALEPAPTRPIPVWIGSWGSAAGLRRVARLGDGWLASAYNTTPDQLAVGRDTLHEALRSSGREETSLPIALATMWTYLTNSKSEARARVEVLAAMLGRDPAQLSEQVLVGDADLCVARLLRYADAGVDTAFIWPFGDPVDQLRRFGAEVAPRLL